MFVPMLKPMDRRLEDILNATTSHRVVTGVVSSCNADVAVIDMWNGGQALLPSSEWFPTRGLPAVGTKVTGLTVDNGFKPVISTTRNELLQFLLEGAVHHLAL